MKAIVILLAFIGIVALIVGYVNQLKQCPPPKVEYRYIPRSFEEDQNDPTKVSQVFRKMFEEPTPFLQGYRLGFIRPNINRLNRFNISQS
jgi:hypothetical protein